MPQLRPSLTAAAMGLAIVLLSTPASAQTKRGLGAHEHGAGKLDIAFEAGKVAFELEVPADDIVGFEHTAKTAKQKAAVEAAKRTLAAGLTLFKLPVGAGCKLESSKAELHTEEAEKKPAAAEKKGHAHGHGHDQAEGGHTEFHAAYAIACSAPDKVTEIVFDYFKAFKKAQKLTVTVVSDKGQKQYEVTRKAPRLTLGAGS